MTPTDPVARVLSEAVYDDEMDDLEFQRRYERTMKVRAEYRRDRIVSAAARMLCDHGDDYRFRGCEQCRALVGAEWFEYTRQTQEPK